MSHIGRGRLQCPRPYHTLVGDISEKQKKRWKLRKFPRGAGENSPGGRAPRAPGRPKVVRQQTPAVHPLGRFFRFVHLSDIGRDRGTSHPIDGKLGYMSWMPEDSKLQARVSNCSCRRVSPFVAFGLKRNRSPQLPSAWPTVA